MNSRTKNEGFAGYVVFKSGIMPEVDGREFVFVDVDVDVFESYLTDYELGEFSTVQKMVVMCGQKRRRLSQKNNTKKV